ncbi:MAG: phosphotyrosine protein phosphatase [Planctomycetota bacterium]|nr:MAG: phosphotyrosine protein phosphatase [Planctomycetota bacterium]
MPDVSPRLNLLFVCGRAQWRSPTAERMFARDPRYASRARGLSPKAARTLQRRDVEWADVLFVMEHTQATRLRAAHRDALAGKPLHVLEIPDDYRYMDPELVRVLHERIDAHLPSD